MTTVMNVQDAKTGLSKILRQAEAGEEVIIARDGVPIVRLVPVDKPAPRPIGFVTGSIDSEFFDPLPDDELARWR